MYLIDKARLYKFINIMAVENSRKTSNDASIIILQLENKHYRHYGNSFLFRAELVVF